MCVAYRAAFAGPHATTMLSLLILSASLAAASFAFVCVGADYRADRDRIDAALELAEARRAA